MIRKTFLLLILCNPLLLAVASTSTLEQQRKEFLALEKLSYKKNSQAFFKRAENLKDYPLYPYLQYQWLKKHLSETDKVKAFLELHKKTRYAGLLKYKWQMHLAKNKQWAEYIKQYSATNNTKLQCYYYRAQYNAGAKKEALLGAKKLWVVGKSQPNECNAVFKALTQSTYFTRELLWQRFEAAISNKKTKVARYVKGFMNKADQQAAALWLKVHSKPRLIIDQKFLNPKLSQAGLIFAHGIDRLASKDYKKAILIWDERKNDFKMDEATARRIETRLAMSLAYRRDENAYQRLSKLSKPDEVTKEWRVRTALIAQDWGGVKLSISELNKDTREKNKWLYWQARALEQTDKPKPADFIYKELASKRDFYGYLSAEKLKQEYQLSDNPIQVVPEMYKRFKNKTDFLVVAELIAVDKPREARRQWWYAVKKLDKKEILRAAKYAQELKWKQVAIFTLAKAKHWDDVGLRFPLAYYDQVQKNAVVQNLSPAVIFGLIRRESAFNQNAQSPVGARGLMQIMPKTGQQIARELKEKWKSTNQLLNPVTNVKYGSYYYKQLLNQFSGHYALAAAAYNAGPHRVKRWLPTENPLAADIWIEAIPFKETRAYVSAVLTYALIYQTKLKKNLLTMKDFMKDVVPG